MKTYDYEIYSNFVYNPTTNGKFVNDGRQSSRPSPGMVHLDELGRSHGYTVFFLTGRPETQRPAR